MNYKTEQEKFWAEEFGTEYIGRNLTSDNYASRISLFSKVLSNVSNVSSFLELGANIGTNLHAIHALAPEAKKFAVEINETAVQKLKSLNFLEDVYHGTLLNENVPQKVDFSFTSGVLIHINPEELNDAYDALYDASNRYIMVCEYYNPSPVAIPYRGHSDRLFKRDFAGEMMEKYPDLALVDYGFCYRNDPMFKMDDLTWFLMEKRK